LWIWLAFPERLLIMSIFLYAIHVSSSMKCLFRSCAPPSFFLLCVYLNQLQEFFCISWIKSFFKYMICNIFSHSLSCLLILLVVSFAVQKLFSLMWSYLFSFAFVAFGFGVRLKKKSSPSPMSRSLLPMFLYNYFMGSGLTFKSLIHFELIFVCGIK